MRIRYSRHALLRMNERGISKREIQAVIDLGIKDDAPGGIRIAIHQNTLGILVVKYRIINGSEINVVTTYYEKINDQKNIRS